MSSEHTADPAPNDRDRSSSQSDGAADAPPLQPTPPPNPSAAAASPFQPAPPPDPGVAATPPFQPAPPPDPSITAATPLHTAPPPDPSAAATPFLQPAPPPDPGVAAVPCLPPIRTFRQAFQSPSGHRGLSIWQSRWVHARPPVSFQVYLTFEFDGWSTWEIEAFAETLWYQCTPTPPTTAEEWQRLQQRLQQQPAQLLAHEPHSLPIRLDITILGPVSDFYRNVTCMQHYRMTRDLDALRVDDGTDWLWPVSPSCRGPNGVQYEGFLINILDPAYLITGGLNLVFFDAMASTEHPADQEFDTFVWVPAVPTEGDGNLWARELCRVWETMGLVKEWNDAFYQSLVIGVGGEENG